MNITEITLTQEKKTTSELTWKSREITVLYRINLKQKCFVIFFLTNFGRKNYALQKAINDLSHQVRGY
jgi:hypothetical protein